MEKKRYIAPMLEISAIEIACDILDVSSSGDLPGTSTDQDNDGTGKDADAGNRDDWGSIW